MPLFLYKAADTSGAIIKDSVDAPDEAKAVARIQKMGLIPINITKAGRKHHLLGLNLTESFQSVFNRISVKDVMFFTQDLTTLLDAGLPVDRSLAILVNSAENIKFKALIVEMLKMVQGGALLSEALSKYPKIFSNLYVNMVRAGETGGVLKEVLARLGIYLSNTQELKEFIISAMVYPIFLIFVSGASVIILMTYVIPKFAVIFNDMGGNIPLTSRLLLDMSNGLRMYWWIILAVFVAIVLAIRKYKGTDRGRMTIDRFKLKLPVVRDFVKKAEVARFSRTLGVLMRSGVPILEGINLVSRIVSNSVVAQSLQQVHVNVKEGDSLSKPLQSAGLFPKLALQMITVGEETGRLEEMLLRIADNYEIALRNSVKRFISLLEPAMILAMAFVVGFIVISMLMAIFSMNEMPF